MNWWRRVFKSGLENNEGSSLSSSLSSSSSSSSMPPVSYNETLYDAEHYWGKFILCEAYLLRGNFTLNEIAQFVRNTRNKHPNSQLFATLDDPAQTAYTSGHSVNINELDSLNGQSEEDLPDRAFSHDAQERFFIGHFPIRHSNFMTGVTKHAPESLENQLSWNGLDKYFATVRTPATVSELKREEESLVQIVPVGHPAEALAAFPNGYFDCDLDPFENYALARELYDRFELSLFGAGATYLGFMADSPIEATKADEIAKYLSKCIDFQKDPDGSLCELITGQTEIYISYGLRD